MTNTHDLWQIYANELLGIVTAGSFDPTAQLFSVAGTTLSVDLANADPAISNENIFQIGNTLPAWSPSYTPKSGLFSSYQVFLDSIDLGGSPNPNLDNLINQAAGQLTAAQNNFIDVQTKALTAYKAYKQISPDVNFGDFVNNQFPTYAQARSALDAATAQYQQLMVKKYGAGYQVIANARNRCSSSGGAADITLPNAYNMHVKTGSTAPAGSGASVLPGQDPPAPASDLFSSYAPAFGLEAFTQKYEEWQKASANGLSSGHAINIKSDAGSYSWQQTGFSGSIGGNFFGDFFSIFGSGSAHGQATQIDTSSEQFSLKVEFTGLGSFGINPGKWYQPGIVQTYRDQLLPKSPDFFGSDGSMGLLPTEIVVGFEPKITLGLSQSDYSNAKSSFHAEASASIGIGPFRIGHASVSTYGSKQDIKYHDASSEITVGPVQSTLPILLGVISTKL